MFDSQYSKKILLTKNNFTTLMMDILFLQKSIILEEDIVVKTNASTAPLDLKKKEKTT